MQRTRWRWMPGIDLLPYGNNGVGELGLHLYSCGSYSGRNIQEEHWEKITNASKDASPSFTLSECSLGLELMSSSSDRCSSGVWTVNCNTSRKWVGSGCQISAISSFSLTLLSSSITMLFLPPPPHPANCSLSLLPCHSNGCENFPRWLGGKARQPVSTTDSHACHPSPLQSCRTFWCSSLQRLVCTPLPMGL